MQTGLQKAMKSPLEGVDAQERGVASVEPGVQLATATAAPENGFSYGLP